MIVWRSMEHISAPSKMVGDREKVFRDKACQVPLELPFGDVATAQWLTTRPIEARVCMRQTDRSTDRLFLCARITRKRFDRFWQTDGRVGDICLTALFDNEGH